MGVDEGTNAVEVDTSAFPLVPNREATAENVLCLRRTKKEWLRFLNSASSLMPLVLGIACFNDCRGIPSLYHAALLRHSLWRGGCRSRCPGDCFQTAACQGRRTASRGCPARIGRARFVNIGSLHLGSSPYVWRHQ